MADSNDGSGFLYLREGAVLDDKAWDRVVRLPRGLRRKREVLAALAGALSFPDYFGSNWDALEECLTDLSWLPERRILIVHGDIPPERARHRATYLEVLRDAVKSWRKDEQHTLGVAFPDQAQRTVESLLAQS